MYINLLGTYDGRVTFRVMDDDNRAYRTDSNGEGLWRLNESTGEWKQLVGTAQFHLRQKTDSGKRRAIKRFLDEGNATFRR